MKTVTKKQVKDLFGLDLEEGQYELSHKATGQLVVGGFNPYGKPFPGKTKDLWDISTKIAVVEDYWLDHGQGD